MKQVGNEAFLFNFVINKIIAPAILSLSLSVSLSLSISISLSLSISISLSLNEFHNVMDTKCDH